MHIITTRFTGRQFTTHDNSAQSFNIESFTVVEQVLENKLKRVINIHVDCSTQHYLLFKTGKSVTLSRCLSVTLSL